MAKEIVFAKKDTPKPSVRVLEYLRSQGGIATYAQLGEVIPPAYLDETLNNLESQGEIRFIPGFPKRVELA